MYPLPSLSSQTLSGSWRHFPSRFSTLSPYGGMYSQCEGNHAGWPPGKLPVELFVLIAQSLESRKDLQNMRLVNREFYSKLANYYFRHLVVHLGPELFPTKLDTGLPLQLESPALDVTDRLIDNAYIFRNFGTEIRHFALALELDECDLATPNVPDLEVLEVRPWGMYRWPIQPHIPQEAIEKVTQSLERSQGIFRMLSHLTQVQELALSCDGGLGYLHGPDINPLSPPRRPAIFGDPNSTRDTEDAPIPTLDFTISYKYEMLERMMRSAKIATRHIPTKIAQLTKIEGITLEQLGHEERHRCPLPISRPRNAPLRPTVTKCEYCKERSKTLRLQPDQLTGAQKRFLLLHIAAQQALVQSYILGIIDNKPSFTNLTKLRISRLPSIHIELLCRDDFWTNLPTLEDVQLAIVPDWRALTSLAPYTVEERQVYPTDAMPKVFRLLNDYIGKQQQIKRLHFEWLCGGELSPGRLQRNNHVLPAPFLKEHRKIINSSVDNLLILPYITHLSLKNCWFTPHVFFRVIRNMAEESLISLELETVSLSGPPTREQSVRPVPPNLHIGLVAAIQQGLHTALPPPWATLIQNILANNPAGAPAETSVNWDSALLKKPLTLSWPHIIDMLTPGDTIRERIHEQNQREDTPPLRLKKELKLRVLDFKSCGYVTVPDSRFILEHRIIPPILPHRFVFSRSSPDQHDDDSGCIEWFMQVNTDRHLARVVNLIKHDEELVLRRVFGFRTGWKDVYDANIVRAAKQDGILRPGHGRFSGRIEHYTEPTPIERYAGVFYEKENDDDAQLVENYDTSNFDRDYDDEENLEALCESIENEAHSERHSTTGRPRYVSSRAEASLQGDLDDVPLW
ncbi:hypothetical protein F4779DRAFT_540604 [Xylariaceae sp. FL0662B]|nr:hypothetical protein F4779DRAFT_540604 [Xylariaceae sp. FL0662B]